MGTSRPRKGASPVGRRRPSQKVVPEATPALDLKSEIVPLVRTWLRRGVSDANLASSVRVVSADPLAGGMKADLVLEVAVNARAVIKMGTSELIRHERLMAAVNHVAARSRRQIPGLQRAVFPEVMLVAPRRSAARRPPTQPSRVAEAPMSPVSGTSASPESETPGGLPAAAERHVLLMQSFAGYSSLESLLYTGVVGHRWMNALLAHVLPILKVIHSIIPGGMSSLASLPVQIDPFSGRIQSKLNDVFRVDADLTLMRSRAGVVDGVPSPPLDALLRDAKRWMARNPVDPVLVHGDSHIGNIMSRRRGRFASVRMIDPNPEVGFSDPSYDYGKLLHLLTPVGWTRVKGARCRCRWRATAAGWELRTSISGHNARVESVRNRAEDAAMAASLGALASIGQVGPRMSLAVASAHIGLAALKNKPEEREERRFALAYAIGALAAWHAQVARKEGR